MTATRRPRDGRLNEDGFRALVDKLPIAADEDIEASTLGHDPRAEPLRVDDVRQCRLRSGSARSATGSGRIRDGLNIRVFCITAPGGGGNVDQLLPRIAQMKLFQGDKFIDHHAYGEGVFGALSDPMFRASRRDTGRKTSRSGGASSRKSPRPACRSTCTRTSRRRSTPSSIRSRRGQGIPDQEPALGAGAFQPADRRAARAHEEAGHVRGRASVGGHQRRHQRAPVRRRGVRHGAARHDPGAAGSRGASAATAAEPTRFCRSRRSAGRSPARWSAARRSCGSRSAARMRSLRTPARTPISSSRKTTSDRFSQGSSRTSSSLDRDYLTIPADEIKDIKPMMTIVGGRLVYDAAAR